MIDGDDGPSFMVIVLPSNTCRSRLAHSREKVTEHQTSARLSVTEIHVIARVHLAISYVDCLSGTEILKPALREVNLGCLATVRWFSNPKMFQEFIKVSVGFLRQWPVFNVG
jgi:hypothetical protein